MKLHHLALSAALAMTLLAAPAAQAQSKKDLAAKVAQLQQPAIDALASGLARDTADRMLSATGQALMRVPPDKREALDKQVAADIKAFYDDIASRLHESSTKTAPPALASYLEEKFNEDELKQIAAWLDSPVAKKYQQLGGDMQSLLQRKLVDDTKAQVEPRLRALEQTLQKRFAAAAPAEAGASRPAAPASTPAAKPAPKAK